MLLGERAFARFPLQHPTRCCAHLTACDTLSALPMPCSRLHVLLRFASRSPSGARFEQTSRGRWIALGLVLGACEPVVATVGIVRLNDGEHSTDGSDGVAHPPPDAGLPGARDAASPVGGEDAAGPRDCVDLIDLSMYVGDAGTSGPIAGETLKDLGCRQLDGGMWLDPANSSIWERRDGEPLLEANQSYSFYFTEAVNLTKLRLTGGRAPCDTSKILEELPFFPRLPTPPACRTLRVGFDVFFLRHSGGQAYFLATPGNPASYQLCKGACE